MTTMTREELTTLIAAAPTITEISTEANLRAELDAWLARYFGVGKVGAIRPGISWYRGEGEGDVVYAEVKGLPFHPAQYLEIEREAAADGVTFRATLWTTLDGRPRDAWRTVRGQRVRCLADLAGLLI